MSATAGSTRLPTISIGVISCMSASWPWTTSMPSSDSAPSS
jgi:hypothetical protein